jgi:type IV pilus assembly protein PilY1
LKIRWILAQCSLLILAVGLSAFIEVGRTKASCMDLNDVPLDAMEKSAPGIIMFVLDDSGSMDWEIMCPEDGGRFDVRDISGDLRGYSYIFADPGDNAYGNSFAANGPILEGSVDANKWKARWAGYNRLYYDPTAFYPPWPGMTDADPSNPRSNPSVAGNTLNLNVTYDDMGEAGSLTTQDIIDAGGVIVDNSDDAGTSINEIILDYGDPGYEETGSGWGSSGASSSYEYNGQSRYTTSSGSYATWTPNIPETGTYKVYVWYVSWDTRDTNALYTVHHAGGDWTTRINQKTGASQWVELGDFDFNQGSDGYIRVTRDGASTGTSTSVDAVRLVPQFSIELPVLSFQASDTWGSSSTGEEYGNDYLYSNANDTTHIATWTAANLDTGKTYNVYARWAGQNANRLSDVHYKTYDDNMEIADTAVDQYQDRGQWNLIASTVNFSSGTGVVEINRLAGVSNLCADAVAFMPAVEVAPLNLIRAHYYTKVGDTAYLVNLDGNFQYYRVNDENNNDTIDNPGELIRITDAEAAAAGIVTGRTYTEERQNFANWYSFYRKRELTAKNAIGKVIDEMAGVYIGISCINSGLESIAHPVRVYLDNDILDESDTLLDTLYSINSSGGTPLRNGLHNAGRYFEGVDASTRISAATPGTYFSTETYPYFLSEYGGSCQQAFTIVMTDGFWNGSHSTVGNADADTENEFDGPPFADTYSNTLADVAMYYYKNDLNTNLDNDLPVNNMDQATHQHMVTYSLSFGLVGTLNRADYPDCPLGDCPAWPQPSADAQTTIDDLWHASVNGRGKYVDASSPMEMVTAMNELKQDIERRLGSSAALATNSIQRQVGTVIYQGTYNTAGWGGELSALPVDLESGSVGNAIWHASEHVPDWDERNIITFDGSSSINFSYDTLTIDQRDLLANKGHDVSQLVNFLRGDNSNSLAHGGPFRVRTSTIGDIVHSAPFYYKGVVYIGANDGLLHAVNAANGHEIFCYIPNMVYGHLSELADPDYSHQYYVDSTPVAARIGDQHILVGGLGKGGKGYFGLDITNTSDPTVLWEYTGDNDLGYSFSKANIIKTREAGHVVLFGNGYDSTTETAALFLLNPATGALVKKIDTGVTGCNGLATPSAVDVDADGYTDFVFAGDLYGNMWKFDLRGEVSDWKVYYGDGENPSPLISVRNTDGDIQPITAAPEVMLDCTGSGWSQGGAGLMVIFGTGRYLNPDDFDTTGTQSFYGIWDWGDIWEKNSGGGDAGYTVARTKFLGDIQSGRTLSNISGTTLLEQTVSSPESGQWLTLSDNTVGWFNPDDDESGIHMGWVFDMSAGERGVREPNLKGQGVVELISITPLNSPCEAGGSSMLYRVSACSGGYSNAPQFDVNDDGIIDEDDRIDENIPSGKRFDQMLFEGIDIGPLRYYSDTEGNINSLLGPPINLGLLYWRVIQ